MKISQSFGLQLHTHLNNPIQLILKEVVGLLDIFQLESMGNQRSGINLACFDEGEDLVAVEADDANLIGTIITQKQYGCK